MKEDIYCGLFICFIRFEGDLCKVSTLGKKTSRSIDPSTLCSQPQFIIIQGPLDQENPFIVKRKKCYIDLSIGNH